MKLRFCPVKRTANAMTRFQRKHTPIVIAVGVVCLVVAYTYSLLKLPHKTFTCTATAYAIQGVTASGEEAGKGIVAVDPSVIPLGSKIRIWGAGKHSGVYHAEDTGKNIIGRRIDIYMEDIQEAKEFGRREVEVAILRLKDEDS